MRTEEKMKTEEANLSPIEVRKYLDKYSLKGWELEASDTLNVNMAVIIPAIHEFDNVKKLLYSLASNDATYFSRTIIIFAVNNLITSSDEIKKDNYNLISLLRSIIKKEAAGDSLTEEIISSGLRIGLIDASSDGFAFNEKDGGVGLARKTGMDIALRIFDYTSDEKKIVVCLDADCTVERNYITEIYRNFQTRKLSAAAVNFRHDKPDNYEHACAITCYEIFLRYYVLGLKYANSPYAFHTIGSTMACDYQSYIKIEGMNKRKAAEDFYFMEKLAKIVPVEKINSTCIYPSSRGSWRVPFGTGQRVKRHLSKLQNEYLLYSPDSFVILKKWLQLYNTTEAKSSSYYIEEAKKIHTSLSEFLTAQNFESDYSRIVSNSKKPEQLLKQKSGWFDGFRTLKLIHYLRDNGFPPVMMFDALDKIFRLTGADFNSGRNEDIPSLEVQSRYLELLRTIS